LLYSSRYITAKGNGNRIIGVRGHHPVLRIKKNSKKKEKQRKRQKNEQKREILYDRNPMRYMNGSNCHFSY
jgi:hypothetical protein